MMASLQLWKTVPLKADSKTAFTIPKMINVLGFTSHSSVFSALVSQVNINAIIIY